MTTVTNTYSRQGALERLIDHLTEAEALLATTGPGSVMQHKRGRWELENVRELAVLLRDGASDAEGLSMVLADDPIGSPEEETG